MPPRNFSPTFWRNFPKVLLFVKCKVVEKAGLRNGSKDKNDSLLKEDKGFTCFETTHSGLPQFTYSITYMHPLSLSASPQEDCSSFPLPPLLSVSFTLFLFQKNPFSWVSSLVHELYKAK